MARDIYFIGIALPPDLNDRITQLQKQLYTDRSMLRPLIPHVTLLHPPSLHGIRPHELVPKIREAAKLYLPLNIELTKVDHFNQKTVFIDVESHNLRALQQRLLKLLPEEVQKAHYARPYRPHITLIQIHLPKQLNVDDIDLKLTKSLSLPMQCEIKEVSCFRWIRPRDYSVEAI